MSKRIYWSQDGTALWHSVDNINRTQADQNQRTTMDSDPTWTTGVMEWKNGADYSQTIYLYMNFPSAVQIDKIGICFNVDLSQAVNTQVLVSNDSTTGIDGNWTEVLAPTSVPSSTVTQYIEPTPTSCTWLKIILPHPSYPGIREHLRKLMLFGTYNTPQFELWTGDGSSIITQEYAEMDNAPNSLDYSHYESFQIRNTDGVAHTYNITISPLKVGGDTIVSNYFTLSSDDGVTKAPTLNISNLAAGQLSGEIRVYCDLPALSNPADGYHYWSVKVAEAP